jgi:hypothetical protein
VLLLKYYRSDVKLVIVIGFPYLSAGEMKIVAFIQPLSSAIHSDTVV